MVSISSYSLGSLILVPLYLKIGRRPVTLLSLITVRKEILLVTDLPAYMESSLLV